MNKLKTTIFATALAGLSVPATALAQIDTKDLGASDNFVVSLASETDLAPTRTGTDGIARLRMTDEEFTNEQASVRFSPDGRRALYVHMRTSKINEGTARESPPTDRMQCALSALETSVDATTGRLKVARPAAAQFDIWATDNDGNEYRNCNKPELIVINGGKNVALVYNYQAAGTNDTKRYAQVYDWDLNKVTIKNGNGQTQNQVVIQAKNNDDCSMHQSGDGEVGMPYFDTNGTTKIASWGGCNGNGNDDGWLFATSFECVNGATGAATECTIKRLFDISLAQREERSRGRCTIGAEDKSFAVCTWTEGNTQPQREGTWIAAVDLSDGGPMGANADGRLLWKDRLSQKVTVQVNGEDREYYSMRAQSMRIMKKAADGSIVPTNQLMFQATLNRGQNTDDRKGGRADHLQMAVLDVSRTGYTYKMPMSVINLASPMLLGLDGTHISGAVAMYGKGDQLMPGFIQVQGSQTGGLQQNADIRTIGYDPTTNAMVNLGQHSAGAPYDRHLYSNYLGNNPGNQGRNFAGCDLVKNPFYDPTGAGATTASKVQLFSACALTGKAPQHTDSAIKPSAFLTVFPVAFSANAPDPQGGYNDNVPGDNTPDNPAPDEPEPFVPGSAAGGCSTGGGSTGGLVALGLGLAAILRRRRK